MIITQRPVSREDEELLFAAYSSTRAVEMAMVPWTAEQREAFLKSQYAAQQADYSRRYLNSENLIIVADDEPAGVSRVDESDTEIRIVDLIVMPEYRRKGIGSSLLKSYCEHSDNVSKPLSVYVESFNPALRLFEDLGFSKVADEGVYFLMQRLPKP